ncbi:zinc finger protein 569-like isoform X2 [Episyrphus balteatus]|uniref:zinc finger protein 569-like isoform X2 n=1 Tax=Episyrphus balteatus TaxID=286459 RepID=UPI00248651BE|nr:zinc finger protein 569-like isoform X2 [Episyrphus balteatus]
MRCAVYNCSTHNKTKDGKRDDVSFFSFPKDEELCQKWIAACCRADDMNHLSSRVCHKHFRDEDFQPRNDFLASYGFKQIRRRLHSNAIPTLLLPGQVNLPNKPNPTPPTKPTLLLPGLKIPNKVNPTPSPRPAKPPSFVVVSKAKPPSFVVVSKAKPLSFVDVSKVEASMCTTCLSNLDEGAKLTEALIHFLRDILHFKAELLETSRKTICRKCYKTLIDLKCFYTQLRDVEVYFENKSKAVCNSKENDIEDEVEDDDDEPPYIGEMPCAVSMAEDESKLDPILIDEDEECSVIEDETPLKKQKTSDNATGKRFVCLTCSKLFMSIDDLRSHEKTAHSRQSIKNAKTVFLQANPLPVSPTEVKCTECGKSFLNRIILEAHMRKHQTNKKSEDVICLACKHKFPNKELLQTHQSKHECKMCSIKFCSLANLHVHIKEKHNGKCPNESESLLENEEYKFAIKSESPTRFLESVDKIPPSTDDGVIQHFLTEIPRRNGKIVRKRCLMCYKKQKQVHGSATAAALKTKQVHTECKQCNKGYCLSCFNNYHKITN